MSKAEALPNLWYANMFSDLKSKIQTQGLPKNDGALRIR